MESRRRSDGHNEPQMQVVGFHVEGQSPSPSPTSLLQDSLRTISSGSPTPVIIPPQFQREASLSRTAEPGANRSLAPEFSVGGHQGTVLRTTSQTDRSKQGTVQLQQPLPPAAAAGAAEQVAQAAAQQQAAVAAAAAELAAAAAAAASSSSTSSSTSTTAPAAPEAAAAAAAIQQPQQAAASSSSSSSGKAEPAAAGSAAAREGKVRGPPDGDKPPPKAPKPASKAERRALQDAQRAAKAAAKGGAAPAGGSSKGSAASAAGADGAAAAAAGRPPKGPGGQGSGAQGSAGAQGGSSKPAAAAADAAPAAAGRNSAAGAGAGGSSKAAAAGGGAGSSHKGRGPWNTLNSTELFAHLQQYRPVSVESVLRSKEGGSTHPAVLALGLRYADGTIKGSTARCVAMVHALSQVIADYHTPEGKSLPRDLMATINASVDFLVRCRPLSVSMGNAIKALKLYLSKIDPAAPEDAAKSDLLSLLQEWLNEKVALADRVLVEHAVSKVYDGDVILTYAYSQVVLEVLLSAARAGKRFRVLVLDSRPELEGRQMMRRLLQADIACSYVFLSGLSYAMREVSKVMLGAAAVLSNGTVFSRAGSAAVAMCAAASSKPVLVCCEAFKFHERVQLDSITHNELGDPDVLAYLPPFAPGAAGPVDPAKGVQSQGLAQWRDIPRLALLNLKYDAMPAEYVTMVVTEFGMIPPSSVPVILREYSESAQLE